MNEPEIERLAELAFNVYKSEVNSGGANVKVTWNDIPEVMHEAWKLVVVAIEAEVEDQIIEELC
jgi:hypothetical protein